MTTPNGVPQPQSAQPTKTGPGAERRAMDLRNEAPAPAAAPAADPIAEAKKYRDEGAAALAAAEKRARIHAVEARKFADEKKGIGAKLSEYEQLKKFKAEQERLDSQAKLNKTAFLKSKFGEDWYDQVVQERLNGGAPTGDTIALEVAKIEERFESKLAERDRKAQEEAQLAQQQRTQNELRTFTASAIEFAKSGVKDFPALEDEFGTPDEIGAALVRVIRSEHERTTQRDENGNVIQRGRVMTLKEAAEGAEKYLVGRAKKLLGRDKYREELTGGAKPAHSSGAVGGPQLRSTEERRTLSNGLTATTPGQKRVFRTDEERRAAAFAAVDAVKNRQA